MQKKKRQSTLCQKALTAAANLDARSKGTPAPRGQECKHGVKSGKGEVLSAIERYHYTGHRVGEEAEAKNRQLKEKSGGGTRESQKKGVETHLRSRGLPSKNVESVPLSWARVTNRG